MSRAREGNRVAFEQLYRRHARRIAGLVYRLLASDNELDELVQETFLAAYEGLDRLREPERFGSWLRSIAVHNVRQKIARRRRWRNVLERLTVPTTVEPGLGEAAQSLAQLPPELRMPFVLHKLDGYTVEETASLCRISKATAKRRCAEASKRLARRMS